jgi:translation initiation factor 2 subunit 1
MAQNNQQRTPNAGSLALARIDKVSQFSAHCKLIEYNDLDAFLPIREVSSGWIKNIHEYIHNGQIVVCRIIFIDHEKNTIDISIKKVNSNEAKEKMGAYNLEKRLAALFQQALKEAKITSRSQKDTYSENIVSAYGSFTNFIKGIAEKPDSMEGVKLPPRLREAVLKLIEASKKEKTYKVVYFLTMFTYNTKAGISQIREILSDIKNNKVDVEYIGAPKYRLISEGEDYIEAENHIQDSLKIIKSKLKNGEFSLEKEKLKREKLDIINKL